MVSEKAGGGCGGWNQSSHRREGSGLRSRGIWAWRGRSRLPFSPTNRVYECQEGRTKVEVEKSHLEHHQRDIVSCPRTHPTTTARSVNSPPRANRSSVLIVREVPVTVPFLHANCSTNATSTSAPVRFSTFSDDGETEPLPDRGRRSDARRVKVLHE